MLQLILFILLAVGYGYFSTQNSQPIMLRVNNFALDPLPLYIVIGITLIIGLLFSWIISLVGSFATAIHIRGKEHVIKESKQTIHDLTKEVNRLKIENAKLQGKLEKDALHEDSL